MAQARVGAFDLPLAFPRASLCNGWVACAWVTLSTAILKETTNDLDSPGVRAGT